MMRSLYSGVSGLQNHQTRMDVIGNNISNINTTGFKKSRVIFQDMLYQQSAGASRPTDQLGGVNPKEVGLGMSIAAIDTIHTQGALQNTGVGTDLAITGNGFFIVKDGDNTYYTRAGDFNVDENGTFVNPANGMKVQGWTADQNGAINTSDQTGNIIIPVGQKTAARETGNVNFVCNLDKRMPIVPAANPTPQQIRAGTWNTQIKVFDPAGNTHTVQVQYRKALDAAGAEVPNTWNATVFMDPTTDPNTAVTTDGAGLNTAIGPSGAANPVPAAGGGTQFTVRFTDTGTIEWAQPGANAAAPAAIPPANTPLTMDVAYDVPETNNEPAGAAAGAAAPNLRRQRFTLNLGTTGSLTNSMTQFASTSSTKAQSQDGYTMGYLDNFKIDTSGVITGVYSNGTSKPLAQVAMASFTNQGGLEKAGNTDFVESTNSGAPNIGPSGIAGKGKINAGVLEMSNVDMATEFTDMIVTQRGFQANSRTIQTSDQMLQELLSLKR